MSKNSVTQRRLLCTRARREQMEKSIIGKYRNQLWFVILASFLFWLLLLFFYHSALTVGKNKVKLAFDSYSNSVDSRENNFLHVDGNSNGSIGILPVKGNPVGEVTGDYAEFVEQTDAKENEEEPINGTGIADDSIKENEEEPINGTGIAETSKTSVSVEDVDQISLFEKESEPENQTIFAQNEAESVDRLPTTENVEESIDEVVVTKNGIEQFNSLPILAINKTQTVAKQPNRENSMEVESNRDSCSGRYIYIHNLPSRFNNDLLKNCQSLSTWTNMCQFISNKGLGPQLSNSEKVFSNSGWFTTNQFSLEVIFHNRMKQYKCLTNDSSLASAIFVSYYAGLDVARYLWGFNTTMRDSASFDVLKWLVEKPEWKSMWGRDHFTVAGRISWDFRRLTNEESDWGNNLLFLPESKNMTMLVIESSPWHNNDFAIPYPTYFHPSSDNEVFQWQNRMRRLKRRYLFSFAGAPRPNLQDSIRDDIINQCHASRRKCKLLECNSRGNKCHKPVNVMKMFQSSVFCLQPPGDSYTRRSAFDSILAGCIPVFFHPGSAYVQYLWHLPKNYKKYSVFIPMNDVKDRKISIEKILLRISKEKVAAMREEVIRLIPKVIYADPRFRLETLEDAFDITVKGVLERVERVRREIREGRKGRNSSFDFPEEYSWKYNLFGIMGEHEWDPFFSKTRN